MPIGQLRGANTDAWIQYNLHSRVYSIEYSIEYGIAYGIAYGIEKRRI